MKGKMILPGFLVLAVVCVVLFGACGTDLTEAVYYKTGNDISKPTPGNEGNVTLTAAQHEIDVSWVRAKDNASPTGALEYRVYYSNNESATTVNAITSENQYIDWQADIADETISNLWDDKEYHVVVAVRDENGNIGYYNVTSTTTQKHAMIFVSECTYPNQKISHFESSGTGKDVIVDNNGYDFGFSAPAAVAYDFYERKVYWTIDDYTTDFVGRIDRCNFDGSDRETIISGNLKQVRGIAIDFSTPNRYIYWTDYELDNVYRASLPINSPITDANPFVLLDNATYQVDNPMGIDIDQDNDDFYWVEQGVTARLRKAPASINQYLDIINPMTNLSMPNDVAVDYQNDIVFWTDEGTGTIQYRTQGQDPNDSNILIDNTNLSTPYGISVDPISQYIYWVDSSLNNLYACPFTTPSGSNASAYILTLGLSEPRGITKY